MRYLFCLGKSKQRYAMDGTSLFEAYNLTPMLNAPGSDIGAQASEGRPAGPRKSTPIQSLQQKEGGSASPAGNDERRVAVRQSSGSSQDRQSSGNVPVIVQRDQTGPVFYDPRDADPEQRVLAQQIQHIQHFQEQQANAVAAAAASGPRAGASYFDAMVQKRRDVMKMISFAVIILLAISIHTVVDFGLKELIMTSDFTFKQELGVRFVYPFIVILLLWNLKALTWSSR